MPKKVAHGSEVDASAEGADEMLALMRQIVTDADRIERESTIKFHDVVRGDIGNANAAAMQKWIDETHSRSATDRAELRTALAALWAAGGRRGLDNYLKARGSGPKSPLVALLVRTFIGCDELWAETEPTDWQSLDVLGPLAGLPPTLSGRPGDYGRELRRLATEARRFADALEDERGRGRATRRVWATVLAEQLGLVTNYRTAEKQ